MSVVLDREWRQWIAVNLGRGCDLQEMADLMGKALPHFDDPLAVIEGYSERYRFNLDSKPVYNKIFSNNIDVGGFYARTLFSNQTPYVQLLDGYLTVDECESLIGLATGKMKECTVVDNETGKQAIHPERTSRGAMFGRSESGLVGELERRASVLTGIPVAHFEGLQVMRYGVGQEYRPHFDWFDPDQPGSASHLRNGGQRVLTVLMYLSTPFEGGTTTFPNVGLRVVPRAGMCCVFASVDDAGVEDVMSLHSGDPVQAGQKWIATLWARSREFK